MVRIHMYRLHPAVLQEFPQCKPVMTGRLHSGNYSCFTLLFCDIFHPCLEHHETRLSITEFQRLLCIFIVPPIKCPGKMSFTADINSNNQSFFSYGCNFCVLCVIIHFDTSLFNKIFTNPAKSVILFYTEVFFSQPSFLATPTFELYRKLLFYS